MRLVFDLITGDLKDGFLALLDSGVMISFGTVLEILQTSLFSIVDRLMSKSFVFDFVRELFFVVKMAACGLKGNFPIGELLAILWAFVAPKDRRDPFKEDDCSALEVLSWETMELG